MKILVIDIGGTYVKIMATGHAEGRKMPSGPAMTAMQMVDHVKILAKDWEYTAISIGYPGKESTPERKLQNYIYGKLDQAPPTATLFWYETDWEIGIKESWVIECTIPKEGRDQLVQDILAGKANEISVGIRWVGGLVYDKHAPPSVTTTWGLFKTEPDM